MTDAEIRSEMKSIDNQIEKLRARRDELQREDDARFMEVAKKNIGRCFRCKNEYVKVVGIPYEELHQSRYFSVNRYQYPAIFVSTACDGYSKFDDDPPSPFWYDRFFSGNWGEGVVHTRENSRSYVEITNEEFEEAFAKTLQKFSEYILSIHRPNQ